VAWSTFVATLALSPKIDHAILFGVALSAVVHLWWELKPHIESRREGDTLVVEPSGVLWFGSAPSLEDELFSRLAADPDVKRVVVRCGGLGRIDLSGAYTLVEAIEQARLGGIDMRLEEVPDHAVRLLGAVGLQTAQSEDANERPDGTGGVQDS
jgi:SulP family sulfate permease